MEQPQDLKGKRKQKLLIYGLLGLVVFVYIGLPLIASTGFWIAHRLSEAKRPPEVIVPQLTGLDLKSAEAKAREAKLNPEVLGKRWDIPAPVGTIVGQIPPAGASVPLGTPVGLEISIEDPDKKFWEEQRKKLKASAPDR
jgi:beta-lactam-binding protein with PASTA domain